MVKVAKLKLQCRVHNIYLQKKIKLNKVFTEKKTKENLKFPPSSSSSSSPTPHSPPPSPPWHLIFPAKYFKEIIGTP